MATVKDELDLLGENITADMKRLAKPHIDTGALDRSFKYESVFISNDKFNIVIYQKYSGKYLNNHMNRVGRFGPGYIDTALKNNLTNGIDSVVNVMADEFLNQIKDNFK